MKILPVSASLLVIALVGLAPRLGAQAGPSAAPTEEPRYFPGPANGAKPRPYSEAVKIGSTLYVSGQLGTLPGASTPVPGGIGPEARQALANLQAILERHGSSLDRVAKVTVFLADIKDWPAFNEIYREFFKTNLPARSALAANGLALGAKVEVEAIAFVPPSP